MAKISVVVPCYLMKEEWLKRLMNSLLNQTIGFENIEAVFVVDASPDDTLARLKNYEQQYPDNILIVNCEEKVGPGGARSLGISYSSGEYIAFIDQDDWVEPYAYEHMYEKAVEYDCDMVESYNTRDEEGTEEGKILPHISHPSAFYNLKDPKDKKKYFETDKPEERKYWAKLYKKAFLTRNDIFFPRDLKYDDNYFKGLTFYLAEKVYVLGEVTYHWMINMESVSMTKDIKPHLDRMAVELMKIAEYEKRGLLAIYHDEMEYIFLEQFFANTVNTIATRTGSLSVELLEFMRERIHALFPNYLNNPYIEKRVPVWGMRSWIGNAMKGVSQVTGQKMTMPLGLYDKIKDLSFLDLIEAKLSQEELDAYFIVYVLFDRFASQIDFSLIK